MINTYYNLRLQASGRLLKVALYDKPITSNAGNIKGRTGEEKAKESRNEEENKKRVLIRAKKRIERIIMSNESTFDKFLTLTIQDPSYTNTMLGYPLWQSYIKRVRTSLLKEGEQLQYFCMPELQDRGVIHFHALLSCPYIPQPLLAKKWGHGSVNIKKIKDTVNTGAYIAKYVTKQISSKLYSHNTKTYLKSQSIKDKTSVMRIRTAGSIEDTLANIKDLIGMRAAIRDEYCGENDYVGKYTLLSCLYGQRDNVFPIQLLSESYRFGYIIRGY